MVLLALGSWQPFAWSQNPAFDVASVKMRERAGPGTMMRETPGHLDYVGIPLMSVIARAYDVQNLRVVGPAWVYSDLYEIRATYPPDTPLPQMQLMLQGLLSERFHLAAHREKREMAGFALVLGKGRPQMHRSEDG